MENTQKQDFVRRLSQCNRGEMIVIIYDIYFAYIEDAKCAYEEKNHDAYKEAIRKAQNVLNELIHALDFSYELSKNLYQLYVYCKNSLSRSMYENRIDGICDTEVVMNKLYRSFEAVAKLDSSKPLMQNTQQVYAGMTYGRTCLNENITNTNSNRGFLA